MNNNLKNIRALTLTILTESPVAISNDQGFGNYTPIKKWFMSDGVHGTSSVATITYELRKALMQKGWHMSGIVLNADKNGKVKNMYAKIEDIESEDNKSLETDVFGFLIPDKQLSKTSPIRIIPPKSLHTFKNDTQLITNKGFLNKEFGRDYYDKDENEYPKDNLQKTQALATEEVFGDYYVYTVTIELDRLGVLEVKNGKYLDPDERIYLDKKIRKIALKDIVDSILELTRTIKHQTVHLKPLAIFGGAFESVIPYFWNDIQLDKNNNLILDNVLETIDSYDLNPENYVASYSNRFEAAFKNKDLYGDTKAAEGYPIKEVKDLIEKIDIGEDNRWYVNICKGEITNED